MSAVTVRPLVGSVRNSLRASLDYDRQQVVPWVTITLAAAIVATGIATDAYVHEIPGSLGHAWATGWPAIRRQEWWTLLSSFVLSRNWFMAATMPVCLAVPLGLYERRAGHARAFAVAFAGHVVGTILLAYAFAPLAYTDVSVLVRAAHNLDYGGSMAIAAALGALASRLRNRTFTGLVIVIGLLALPLHHQMADSGHLVAAPLGFVTDRIPGWRRS